MEKATATSNQLTTLLIPFVCSGLGAKAAQDPTLAAAEREAVA